MDNNTPPDACMSTEPLVVRHEYPNEGCDGCYKSIGKLVCFVLVVLGIYATQAGSTLAPTPAPTP